MSAQPKSRKPYTAEDILDCARSRLVEVRGFYRYDQSELVFQISQAAKQDLRKERSKGRKGKTPQLDVLFGRLLDYQHVTGKHDQLVGDCAITQKLQMDTHSRPRNHGLRAHSFRSHGISNTNDIRNRSQCSKLLHRLELELGVKGISMALLPALPKLPRLYDKEVSRMIGLLRRGSYAEVMVAAWDFNKQLAKDQDLYNTLMV
ncbi:hypothetical protein ASPWEDRAFT_177872 [Aspergillus wentii DTO 134E9]|uniref:Uncharacterized protein n=1 Tax=Aspergillus wentii DTO 134E9 TaxID=1073089 RepID=A0A1L9R3S1_ASPWE|nr:uncharacterized protein ASPWEDRAFT_177872 [Aspergillus wentii DTO 134E9]OJJ29566.1 hypothetical protein ASPWEDRAFT_177872 [Aspergillus wentii DTO 134E9]